MGEGPPPEPFSRCLECNEVLAVLPRSAVWDRVPDHVLLTRERFSACPGCQRVFWAGSHYRRLDARILRLAEALQGLKRPV